MIVRIYTHSGFVAHPLPDNSHLLVYPYLGTAELDASDGAVTSSPDAAPPATKVARVEVSGDPLQPYYDQRVHFEVTPAGHDQRVAGRHSPTIASGELLAFGPNYTLSVWGRRP